MQDSENYTLAELGAALQQAIGAASPSMSIDGPSTSSERSVRPRIRSITIGRATADVEVNEDTSESRTWTP
eukprot:10046127-Alexandrium_andersonii.AAC.1